MDPENLENLDVDSEEDLRNDAMYNIMLDKWQRWGGGGVGGGGGGGGGGGNSSSSITSSSSDISSQW